MSFTLHLTAAAAAAAHQQMAQAAGLEGMQSSLGLDIWNDEAAFWVLLGDVRLSTQDPKARQRAADTRSPLYVILSSIMQP